MGVNYRNYIILGYKSDIKFTDSQYDDMYDNIPKQNHLVGIIPTDNCEYLGKIIYVSQDGREESLDFQDEFIIPEFSNEDKENIQDELIREYNYLERVNLSEFKIYCFTRYS